MTDDRKSAIALIAGSLGGMLTMAIHPSAAAAVLTPDQVDHLALASAFAHTLAMVSFLVLFLGAFGLTRRLMLHEVSGRPDRLAFAALCVYGFAEVALMLAAAVSGFIVPGILRHTVYDDAARAPQWHIVVDAVFQFNQAFARIYSVTASASILLWSASALRHGGLGRGIAIYGCIVAPLLILLIGVGHLRPNLHGMALIVLAHAIWFVISGAQLLKAPTEAVLPQA